MANATVHQAPATANVESDDEKQLSFDDVIAKHRDGDFQKIRIVALLAEGGIREFEFNREDTATINSQQSKKVDIDSASLSIDRAFGVVDALYTMKCSGNYAEELCEGSEIALLDTAMVELARAKNAIVPAA